MGNAFDQFDAPQANPFDQFDAAPEKSNPLRRLVADPAISLLKGAVSVPEAAVGLADMVSGGQAGKLSEEAGFRPKEAKNILDEYLSPQQQAANTNLKKADGFVDTLGAVASNPSVVPHAVLESLPLMGAGGVVARALPVSSAVLRGALGEGITGMGSSAESIRQESDDGLLSGKQALAAGASGAGVAAFGAAGGKLAQRMGIGDVDTLLAGGVQNIGKKGLLKSAASGALSEGVLEELPQSVWEQGAQNIALDRPLGEGVGQAAAMGLVTGAAMGAGGGAIGSIYAKARQEKIDAEPQPEIAGLLPAPTLAGTPNDQMLQAAVARQNEVDAAQKNADEIYAERAAYEQAMQALYPGGATITADLVPLQQKIDDLLGIDQAKLKGLARVKYQKDLEKAFGEVVGITQDDNGREIPLTLGGLLDSQATAEQMAKRTLAVRHTEQQTAARLQQLADDESTIQPDAIPVVGPLSAAANQAVQTGVSAQVQMQQAAEQVAQAQAKAPKNKQDQAADPGPLSAIAAPSASVLAQNAPNSAIPTEQATLPPESSATPPVTQQQAQALPGAPAAQPDPVRAYPKGQATMLAGRLTRQGFPSEVYPHPTIADAYAIRVAQGESNGQVAEQAVPPVAAQGAEGRRADAPGSADVSLSAPAGDTERTGDGAEVAASGVRQTGPAGTAGAQSAPLSKKPRKQIDAGRDSLFVAIAKAGGMDTDELLTNGFDQNDITYEGAARVGKKSGVLGKAPRRALSFGFALPLHKKGGMSFDGMREAMQQYGYLPEGATKNDAIDLFRRELGGERVLTPGAAESAAETDRAAYDAQMLAEQERIDAERAVEDAIEEETGYADLSAEEQAHADAYDDLVFDEDASPQDSDDIAAGMRAMGFSEKEINDELAKTAEAQGTGGQTDAGTSQEIGADRPGNGAQEVGARQGTGSQEAEGLTGQSNEEAAAQFAQQEETAVSKEQADRERDAVPFSLAQQSQPKPQGVQGGMFTPDGRIKKARPDLAAEVDSVLAEEGAPAADVSKKAEKPDTSAEPVQKTEETAPAASPEAAVEKTQAVMEPTWDSFADFWNGMLEGKGSITDVQESFATILDRAEEFKATIGKLKNDQLKRVLGGWARPDMKKADLVERVYDSTLTRFLLNKETPSKTWMYGQDTKKVDGDYNEQLRAIVNGLTDADLAEFRDKIAENGKARKAALEEKKAAVADPKTLEDFNLYVTYSQNTGKTQKEAYQALTSEQKALWDSLAAEKTRSERASRVGAQRSEVTVAATTTEGQIVTTKHTKTGQDLFVVKAAERVERDVYTHWNATAKRLGGWYSSFRGNGAVPGFQFKTMENAQAFLKFIGGDVTEAKEVVQERRDSYADDRSQSAVERLNEMAERLEESADASMSQDRKVNTARRARFAASAEAAASSQQALAKTMRNIAGAIESGAAKFLDKVRQKVQVELLQDFVRTAKDDELRAKYPSYADQERHKGEPASSATAEHAVWPSYTMYRSDLANLGRKLIEVEGTKKIGQQILKVSDDVSDAYLAFAKSNLNQVMKFSTKDGGLAAFNTRDAAESAIARSGFKGKAVPYQIKRGEHTIIYSPTEAQERGVWQGDGDKKITLTADFGAELVEKLGRVNRSREKVAVPWQFETTYTRRKRLAQMGIETNAEFRTALREFIGLREAPKEADKIKALERAMIGRKNDGLDFFPTPASTAQEMLDAADIKEGMSVLEPSAGMGHIAEQIREAGVEPDVVEMANDRKELLEEKGFNVVGRDFMEVSEQYDRIIMNPPFSDRRDAQHVQHAYSLLKPGGRLVSIMGEGVFFGQDKKAEAFRNWLEEVGGTSEKLPEGSFLDPSLPVNTGVNARMVVVDKPAGQSSPVADEADNTGAGNRASPGKISIADKAIYGMASEGKSAKEILGFIAGASRNPFNRQIARLLLKTGIAPSVTAGTGKGWKFNAGEGNQYAAGYNPKTDTVALFRATAAERNMLHELMHAATLKALAKNGLAAAQMKTLFKHVKDSGMLKGMYGMSDVDEFVAEAFTNPKFQEALKKAGAPKHASTLGSAWHWFVRIVRGILGVDAKDENALGAALDLGIGVMRENMKAVGSAAGIRYAESKLFHDTRSFVESVLNNSGAFKFFDFATVGTDEAAKLKAKTGLDLDGYKHSIDDDAVRHAIRKHGDMAAEIARNQIGINADDLAMIPNIVESYDSVERGETQRDGRNTLVYKKTYGNGVTYYVEEVRTGRKKLVAKTMWKVGPAVPRTTSEDGVVHTSETSGGQPDSNIADNGDGSNPDIRYNVTDDDAWTVSEPSKLDDVIYAVQDKHVDTKRVLQAIKATGQKIADQIDPYLQEELFHGRATKGVKDFIDFELRPLLKEMQDGGVDMGDFEEYLWNRHAPERNAQIARINPEMKDGGAGIKTAEARAYLANLSGAQRATFEALARRIDGINKGSQRVLVESGLEKQETVDAWNGAYQHYVPLQREDVDSGHVGTGKGFSVRGSSSKRAMGSGRAVVDIIANITMQRERNIVRAEKNRVSNALMGLAVGNPNADFWTVDQAPKERVVEQKAIYTVTDAAGEATEFTRMSDAEKFARSLPEAGIEQTWGDRVTERVVPGFSSRDNVLLTRINGEDHYIIFNERDERAMRMAQSLKNLDMDNLGRVLSIVGKATRYLASINTQYNPVFGVINLIRDAQGALINLSSTPLAGQQKKVFGYTKDALIGIYQDIRAHRAGKKPASNWAGLFEEFQKEGGQTGYRDQYANAEQRAEAIRSELGQFKEGKARQLTRGVFGWLSDYNETMENAVRLAAYKTAKEQGMSRQQAASLAKNITVNFNRKGQMATQVGALYAFFNASVQGSARLAETLFEPNNGDLKSARLSKVGKKIIAGGILLGTMQALLLAAAGFDDDEPPDFVRERNLILPIGGGKYLTLAMPLGFHVLPGIGRIATEFVLSGGKDPLKRIAAFASMFAESFNPIGSSGFSLQTITPSVVDPFAALAENRDFTGKEIYRENRNAMSPTPGHARAKDVATVWSRYLSESINWMTGGTEFKPGLVSPSPDGIDYLLGQLTGGVGREVNKLGQTARAGLSGEDLPLYKIPLVGRFVGDTEGQSGQSAKFYAAIKQVNMHEAEYKGLLKSGRRQEAGEYLAENPGVRLIMAGNHAERAIQKLRAVKRDLIEKDADKEQVRAIDERITATMRSFSERAGAVI